jgi:hypothetical protein
MSGLKDSIRDKETEDEWGKIHEESYHKKVCILGSIEH